MELSLVVACGRLFSFIVHCRVHILRVVRFLLRPPYPPRPPCPPGLRPPKCPPLVDMKSPPLFTRVSVIFVWIDGVGGVVKGGGVFSTYMIGSKEASESLSKVKDWFCR